MSAGLDGMDVKPQVDLKSLPWNKMEIIKGRKDLEIVNEFCFEHKAFEGPVGHPGESFHPAFGWQSLNFRGWDWAGNNPQSICDHWNREMCMRQPREKGTKEHRSKYRASQNTSMYGAGEDEQKQWGRVYFTHRECVVRELSTRVNESCLYERHWTPAKGLGQIPEGSALFTMAAEVGSPQRAPKRCSKTFRGAGEGELLKPEHFGREGVAWCQE